MLQPPRDEMKPASAGFFVPGIRESAPFADLRSRIIRPMGKLSLT